MAGRSILLVDDDTDFLDMLEVRLSRNGYKVLRAIDGIQGTEIAKKAKPDLIIMDILMPGKDGIQMGADLLSSFDTMLIPVVVVTALDDAETKAKARKLGAAAFFTKPFDENKLMSTIKRLIG